MNRLFAAAEQVQRLCQAETWSFCFIGGLAVQHWGEARVTVTSTSPCSPASATRRAYQSEKALTAEHDRIWLLTSHTRADVDVIAELLAERGYEKTDVDARPGASVALWVRGEG